MREELGFETSVDPAFSFIYKAALDNELTEYEFDHVLIGEYDGQVFPNKDEVADYCYMNMEELRGKMANHPEHYTEWFKIALPMLDAYLDKNNAMSNENQ
jgi:isopentenyl-diphosphate delta-isomerase